MALLVILGSFASLEASEFLYYRLGSFEDSSSIEQYFIYDHGEEKISLGVTAITGDDGFHLFKPHVYLQTWKGLELGLRYQTDSFDNKYIIPAIRIKKRFSKFFFLGTADYPLNLRGGQDQIDIWTNIFTLGEGLYYGAEARYYHTFSGGDHNYQLRPLKIGYRFKNGLVPFAMYEKYWKGSHSGNAGYIGIEWVF